MKWLCFALFAAGALAQDITFTNKTMTFTNLEGRVYTNVTLVKANLDGIIWRGDGVGLVFYTNLSPTLLESLGIPYERVQQAKIRAEQKAKAAAQQRIVRAAQEKAQGEAAFVESKLVRVHIQGRFDGRRASRSDQVVVRNALLTYIDKSEKASQVLIFDYHGSEADGAEIDAMAYYCGQFTRRRVLGGAEFKEDSYGSKSRAVELIRFTYLHGPKPDWTNDEPPPTPPS
jgi:hypothetical protein